MYTAGHERPIGPRGRAGEARTARGLAWAECSPGSTVAGELSMPTSPVRTEAPSRASTPFDLLESHWAVAAIDHDARRRALAVAEQRWAQRRARQFVLDDEADSTTIGILATAYDVAALDILVDASGALATDPGATRAASPVVAGASRAFTLHGALPLPVGDDEATIYRLLHIASLAVVGHREADFVEWLDLQQPIPALSPADDLPWEGTLRAGLAEIWLTLATPPAPDAYERVIARLGALREMRERAEARRMAGIDRDAVTRLRFHLFTLYHLVDAAAALTMYLTRGEPASILSRLSLHFTMARSAATGESMLDIALAWMHGASYVLARRRSEQLTFPGITDETRRT